MKTDKKITVSLTEKNYQKVSDFAKENGVSFKLALNSFIEKGFIKKANDYAELINFFKENFTDKNFWALAPIMTSRRINKKAMPAGAGGLNPLAGFETAERRAGRKLK